MKLLSVNVSLPKEAPYMNKTTTTGIFKEPVSGRVMLRWQQDAYPMIQRRTRGTVSRRGSGTILSARPASPRT